MSNSSKMIASNIAEPTTKTNSSINNDALSASNASNEDTQLVSELLAIRSKRQKEVELLIELGLEVFPVFSIKNGWCTCPLGEACQTPGKHPATPNGYKNASTDPLIVKKLFNDKFDERNIGIATGKNSGIICLDIDPRNGGVETFYDLQYTHGPFPETWLANTGGGGWHYFFKYPNLPFRKSKNPFGRGIDLLSDGSYLVGPSSMHKSGKEYEWDVSSSPDIVPLAEAPAWLLEMLISGKDSVTRVDPKVWQRIVIDGVSEGTRNVTATSLIGHLLGKRVDPMVALEFVSLWNTHKNNPPLSLDELEGIFSSILKRELDSRMEFQS